MVRPICIYLPGVGRADLRPPSGPCVMYKNMYNIFTAIEWTVDRDQPYLRGVLMKRGLSSTRTLIRAVLTGRSTRDGDLGSAAERGKLGLLKLPEVLGVAEARNELAPRSRRRGEGAHFHHQGAEGPRGFVINVDVFRRLQDAYLEVVGELETVRILEDEAAVRAIRESSDDDRRELFTLSEVKNLVGEVDEVDGDAES